LFKLLPSSEGVHENSSNFRYSKIMVSQIQKYLVLVPRSLDYQLHMIG